MEGEGELYIILTNYNFNKKYYVMENIPSANDDEQWSCCKTAMLTSLPSPPWQLDKQVRNGRHSGKMIEWQTEVIVTLGRCFLFAVFIEIFLGHFDFNI
jgi:hypothetical protein